MLSSGLILRERYRIIKQIGSGGSSLVYLAEDVAIGKKWAIKFLRLDEDENKWLAQNEINMMINLDNEMFPRIVDAWQEQSGYYIVSDYVEGVTLDKVIKANQISKRTILKWLGEIAEGLKYLHTCRPSILYLDLKLENIMLKSDGSIKMIDFGIAGRIADKGSLYGTVGYAAPEQYYNCGELLDERTDVFTFGMLMYAVMTGDCPSAKLDDQTEKVKSARSLSRKVKGIILKCIQADKELRYRNMEEVLNALDALGVRRKGIHQIKLLAAAGVMVIGISGFCAVNMVVAEPVENVKEKMLSEANGHISHGEYTDEGIRIISGYIDSGCLDYETSQKFIYVVAKHYFEKKRNYREALRYFSELNEEMYEDTSYYIRLCKLQLSFEEDIEAYAECLDDFAKYNRGLGYCSARYENDLMLATLYETLSYGEDESKELECLQNGLSELSYAKSSGLFADDNDEYEAEYCRRLCILYEEQGDAENTCKYGEMALTLIAEDRTDIREDIKARIGVVSNY